MTIKEAGSERPVPSAASSAPASARWEDLVGKSETKMMKVRNLGRRASGNHGKLDSLGFKLNTDDE